MTEDISIPEIEISEGWYVSDIQSLQDAEDAADYLVEKINQIEHQLIEYQTREMKLADRDWYSRAMVALKYKKYARVRVLKKLDYYEALQKKQVAQEALDAYKARANLKMNEKQSAGNAKIIAKAEAHKKVIEAETARKAMLLEHQRLCEQINLPKRIAEIELEKQRLEVYQDRSIQLLKFLRDQVSHDLYVQLNNQFDAWQEKLKDDSDVSED